MRKKILNFLLLFIVIVFALNLRFIQNFNNKDYSNKLIEENEFSEIYFKIESVSEISAENGYSIEIKYDHSGVDQNFTDVTGINYELYGPTSKSNNNETLLDAYYITDGYVEHKFIKSYDSVDMETVDVTDSNLEWTDGIFDNDINVGYNSSISTSIFYSQDNLFTESDYRLLIWLDGSATQQGIDNGYVWNSNLNEQILTTPNNSETPNVSTPVLIGKPLHNFAGTIQAEFEYSLDSLSQQEYNDNNQLGNSPSDVHSIDIVGSDGFVYGSKTIEQNNETGIYSGNLMAIDLPANQDDFLIHFVVNYGDNKSVNSDEISIKTGKRGTADKTVKANVFSTTDSSATGNLVFADIPQKGDNPEYVDVSEYNITPIEKIEIVNNKSNEVLATPNVSDIYNNEINFKIENLFPLKEYECKAIIYYTGEVSDKPEDSGLTETRTAETIFSFKTQTVGPFEPEVESLIFEEPIIDPNTKQINVNGKITVDIAPTDGEWIYDASQVTKVRLIDTFDNHVVKEFNISEAQNEESKIILDFTLNDLDAFSKYSFIVEVDSIFGTTTSDSVYNLETSSRGDVDIKGASISEARVIDGPILDLNWELDLNLFGYDYSDFNEINLEEIKVFNTHTNTDGTEIIGDVIYDNKVYSNELSGQISLSNGISVDSTNEIWAEIYTTSDTSEISFFETNHLFFDVGKFEYGPYHPNILNYKSSEMMWLNPLTQSFETTISFDLDILTTTNEEGYQSSNVESIKLFQSINNGPETEVIDASNKWTNQIPYLVNTNGDVEANDPNKKNHFKYHLKDLKAKNEYDYKIVVSYVGENSDTGDQFYKPAETSEAIIEIDVESLGYESIEETDVKFNSASSTKSTYTIDYDVSNDNYDIDNSLYETYEVDKIDIYDSINDKVIATSEASCGKITVSGITPGTNVLEQGWEFRIHTKDPTLDQYDSDHNFIVGSVAYKTEIDKSWAHWNLFDDSINNIVSATSPTIGEEGLKNPELSYNSLRFNLDIDDPDNLINYNNITITDIASGSEFDVKREYVRKDSDSFIVIGLSDETNYGTEGWTLKYQVRDILYFGKSIIEVPNISTASFITPKKPNSVGFYIGITSLLIFFLTLIYFIFSLFIKKRRIEAKIGEASEKIKKIKNKFNKNVGKINYDLDVENKVEPQIFINDLKVKPTKKSVTKKTPSKSAVAKNSTKSTTVKKESNTSKNKTSNGTTRKSVPKKTTTKSTTNNSVKKPTAKKTTSSKSKTSSNTTSKPVAKKTPSKSAVAKNSTKLTTVKKESNTSKNKTSNGTTRKSVPKKPATKKRIDSKSKSKNNN